MQQRERSGSKEHEHEGLSLSASFHRAEGEKEREEHQRQSKEVEAKGFRSCPQHSSEKLTLYAARARCFGCVKCFQEGVLNGQKGQSLQRAQEEVKEKLVRQHATLLQQSRTVRENEQVTAAAKTLIEQERCAVQAAVKRSVEHVQADLALKSAALAQTVEEWRQGELGAADAAAAPLRAGMDDIDAEIAQLSALCAQDDDALLERFYASELAAVDGGEECTRAALAACDGTRVPRIDASQALKSCAHMGFGDYDDYEEGPVAPSGPSSASRRHDSMSDAAELDRVAVIALGNTDVDKLSPQDRRLFWKHRVTLTDKKKALLKLLKCAQWDKERQVRQLLDLVPQWVDVDPEDALEMLGASYMYGPIRALAVRSLTTMPDGELSCILMPLTMALRYDVPNEAHLATFLVRRSLTNLHIAVSFYWYLNVERSAGGRHVKLYTDLQIQLLGELQKAEAVGASAGGVMGGDEAPKLHELLRRQEQFVAAIHGLCKEAKRYKETRPKQIERLMSVLAEGGAYAHLTQMATPVNLPHQPQIFVKGIVPAQSVILKSAMNPVKLVMRTENDKMHTILYKASNDLRRDQLILSCIDMMDMLLQKEGVDLRITTYKVTATTIDEGLVEWVEECFPLSAVLAEHDNDIRLFFRKHAREETHHDSMLDNFVKSCAGYCVISFLLGIGDRHLDNLMLTTDGRLFHVDFEYILGNDPKPFQPPMKLSEQMVVAMGGRGSRDYMEFHKFCCKAFLILRKSAKLFVALFDLVDLNLGARHHGMSYGALICERFRLDLSREEAVQYMQGIIQESLGAIFPQVVDVVHRWRLFFKT
eukprot:Tamp_05894.p1 GENE.Tamp_05894~~Tamp_05894.p1  ORF type:complete len:820 (+),score=205.08 Tamp_05894:86-2545(+)